MNISKIKYTAVKTDALFIIHVTQDKIKQATRNKHLQETVAQDEGIEYR